MCERVLHVQYINIVSEYNTSNDRLDFSENYERKFKKYQKVKRVYPTSKKTKVDIYPKERTYLLTANYMMMNRSEKPMSHVFVTERMALESLQIENATLIKHDSDFGTYLFEFHNELQTNDSVVCNFKLINNVKAYDNTHRT